MTIKTFSIEYDAINRTNTFTNGDTINGRIIVEVSGKTKIQSLIFTAKGTSRVHFTVCNGRINALLSYDAVWAQKDYYKVKHHVLRAATRDGTEVIGKGRHEFPFSFKIPEGRIPSSFKSSTGNIVYKLTAELKQSMKLTKKTKTHFRFVSKADMDIPRLMEPQRRSNNTSVKTFGSGNISMDVHTKRMGYQQGEVLEVTVEVNNNSTRSVKPKFILYEHKIYSTEALSRYWDNVVLRDESEVVAASGKETVTKLITIPKELPPSILNCSMIMLTYWLKVYLDVKYGPNPEIKLPIVVLPSFDIPAMRRPPGLEPFGNLDQAPWSTTQQPPAAPQAEDPPPPYGAYALYPSDLHITEL